MSDRELLLRLVKDVNEIRSMLGRATTNLPLYDINSENTPIQITANQNNYVPGNYDVLRLYSSAAYNITGIANGVQGRKIRLLNVGSFTINLINESLSSLAQNRFLTPSQEDVVLFPKAGVDIYYDSTLQRWNVQDPPSWRGQYGTSSFIYKSSQSVPDDTDTKITGFTVTTNVWGIYDSVNSRFVIQQTGFYIGVFSANYVQNNVGYRSIRWVLNSSVVSDIRIPGIDVGDALSCAIARPLNQGDVLEMYALQTSGVATNIFSVYVSLSRLF